MESSRKADEMHRSAPLAIAIGATAFVMLLPIGCTHGGQRASQGTSEVTTESYVIFDEGVAAVGYVVEVVDPTGRRRFRCPSEISASGEGDDCSTLRGIDGPGAWTLRYRVRHFDGTSEEHHEVVVLEGDESHLRVRIRYVLGREGPYVRQWHTRHPRDISVVFRTEESGKPRMAIVNGNPQSLLLNWNVADPPVVLVPSSQDPRRRTPMAGCGQLFIGPVERIDTGDESVLMLTRDDSPLPSGSYRLLVRGQLVDPEVTVEDLESLAPVSVYADVEFMFRVGEDGSPFGLITSPHVRGAMGRREPSPER